MKEQAGIDNNSPAMGLKGSRSSCTQCPAKRDWCYEAGEKSKEGTDGEDPNSRRPGTSNPGGNAGTAQRSQGQEGRSGDRALSQLQALLPAQMPLCKVLHSPPRQLPAGSAGSLQRNTSTSAQVCSAPTISSILDVIYPIS